MMRLLLTLTATSLISVTLAFASEPLLPPSGDPWATLTIPDGTPNATLLREGARVYTFCASCHLADGGGRPDGAMPRLAGQSAETIIVKLKRIREGGVFLPVMAAFANSLAPREVTAVAVYIASLPAPKHLGHGGGKALDAGKKTYERTCAACHGPRGEGNDALLAPRLCGQHAGYIVRRVGEVVTLRRGDANPGMATIAASLTPEEIAATADYLSRNECLP